MSLSPTARAVAAAFVVSGTTHLVRPRTFEPLMPRRLPAHRQIILGSGVAELLCAAGLTLAPSRRVAGYASAALLVAVFPGNVKMARDAARRGSTPMKVATLARLPLQLPMIRAMLRVARSS